MNRLLVRLASFALAGVLALGALGLLWSASRRVETQLRLRADSVAVQGVVLEKLVEQRPDRLLPFDVPSYVVRYAFPTPDQGQMRSGEQVVTRYAFRHLGGQGALAPVTVDPDDPAVSAIDPRLTFPAGAGWRLGIGIGLLVAALGVALAGTRPGSAGEE
ncbi:MAG: hypothetical protein P8Z40_15860 [Chloroflexota bacterium]